MIKLSVHHKGRFGWVPKVSEYLKKSTLLCSRAQQVYAKKLHGVNLLTNIEEVEEKDDNEEDHEVDFYDQLRKSIETGKGVLQDEVMDKTNEASEKKCVKPKKISKKKSESGTRGKERRRRK